MRRLSVLLFFCLLPALALAATPPIRANKPVPPYIVVKGDTLWSIAARHFKNPRKWLEIWGTNKQFIINPHRIYPNQVVLLDIAPTPPAQTQPVPIQVTPTQSAQVPVISARVISIYGGVSQAGSHTIVVIDKGLRDGVENGLVLTLYHHNEQKMAEQGKPPALPEMGYGQLQVLRTFNKISYASVAQASLPVMLLDIAKNDVKATPEIPAPQTNAPVSSTSIPPDGRNGQDARKCLELESNREIAACAEKYR